MFYKGDPIISVSNLNYFLKGSLTSLPFFDLIPSELILSEFLLCIIRFFSLEKKKKSLSIKKKDKLVITCEFKVLPPTSQCSAMFPGPPTSHHPALQERCCI